MLAQPTEHFRILIADDEQSILDEYAVALRQEDEADDTTKGLNDLEAELFGVDATTPEPNGTAYDLTLCRQGDEAVETVRTALAGRQPYAMAFLDVRMPPGPDGVETAERIRALDPNINIVFVTGFSDLHPEQIARRVAPIDKLLYCQKPVQARELQQFAHALTAKWQAERNLRATKERLQHLLTSSPAVIYSCAPQGDYAATFVSDNVEAILGFSAGDFLQDPKFWLNHIHPEDLPYISAKIERVLHDRQVVTEYRFRHQDGDYRWMLDETRLICDANGHPVEFVGYWIDITDRKTQQAQLEHQALHDALTGLPNRTLLVDRLDHALCAARRDRMAVALLLLDLNRFKDINDTLGHRVGDKVLSEVAERLAKPLRESDTVARLGGDEFAILLPAMADLERARNVATRLLESLDEPFQVENLSLEVGASIGIALYPVHAEDGARLLQCADVAMYAAKHNQSHVALYDASKDHNSIRHLTLTGELRQAIEHDHLLFHYQPKIDLRTRRICGVEALARWHHPTLGFIPPNEFVAQAEHTGLIQPLTLWAFNTALRQLAELQRAGLDIGMAVNLSARNLHEERLPDLLADLLRTCEVAPEHVTLEITESAIMLDPERALEVVSRFDAIGVHLAIDDFGTGYSSLAQLKRLPVDQLKIDKSFVMQMTEDENDLAIVRSTIDLAHNLGLEVVAEGIESHQILQLLDELGCDIGQGYFICHPLPIADLTKWLADALSDVADLTEPRSTIAHIPPTEPIEQARAQ